MPTGSALGIESKVTSSNFLKPHVYKFCAYAVGQFSSRVSSQPANTKSKVMKVMNDRKARRSYLLFVTK